MLLEHSMIVSTRAAALPHFMQRCITLARRSCACCRDGDRNVVYKEIKHLSMLKQVKQVVEIFEVVENGKDMYIVMEVRARVQCSSDYSKTPNKTFANVRVSFDLRRSHANAFTIVACKVPTIKTCTIRQLSAGLPLETQDKFSPLAIRNVTSGQVHFLPHSSMDMAVLCSSARVGSFMQALKANLRLLHMAMLARLLSPC